MEILWENGKVKESGEVLYPDIKHGRWQTFGRNGNLLTDGYYEEGKKHGEWQICDNYGKTIIIQHYDKDVLVYEEHIYDDENEYDNVVEKREKWALYD